MSETKGSKLILPDCFFPYITGALLQLDGELEVVDEDLARHDRPDVLA